MDWRIIVQGQVRARFVIQRDDRTPIGPGNARFFTDGTLGQDLPSGFMK
jgi:hypothetical protein